MSTLDVDYERSNAMRDAFMESFIKTRADLIEMYGPDRLSMQLAIIEFSATVLGAGYLAGHAITPSVAGGKMMQHALRDAAKVVIDRLKQEQN